MRAVIQRVASARVSVGGPAVGEIGPGWLVFFGEGREEAVTDADWLVSRVVKLRAFERAAGKMDASLHNDGPVTLVVNATDRDF